MFIGTAMSLLFLITVHQSYIVTDDAVHQNAHDLVTAAQSNRRAVMMQTEEMYPSFHVFISLNW